MNYVGLIGRLTKDPELKILDSGKKYVNITIAVDRFGNQTDFIPCVAWEKTAEVISNYFKKGRKIAIQGNINVRNYKAQNGETKWVTNVLIDRVEFVDSNPSSGSNYNSTENFESSKKTSVPFIEDSLESNDDEDFPF